MPKVLFLTGGTGFIGRAFLRRLDPGEYQTVHCLGRRERPGDFDGIRLNLKYLQGDIFDFPRYAGNLESSDVVVHMGAATGAARPEEYFRVNSEGTRFLVDKCRRAGVRKFLYVSTIAVKYPDLRDYPYARSKMQGEEAARESGMDFAIARPTVVIGKNAANWRNLAKLAKLPIPVVPGDGNAVVQPIHVDDLADCLLRIVDRDLFGGESYDLGGPERIRIDDFIARIHRRKHAVNPRILHMPLGPVLPLLRFLEKIRFPFLPFTAGQLAFFRNDGVVEPNEVWRTMSPKMKSIDEILREVDDDGSR
jgi:nucleoside-diphosphate-sugar epimerase